MKDSKTPKKQIQYTQEQLDQGLFKAIEAGYDTLVKVYIEKGANVHTTDSPDFRKSTPLHYAVEQGNLDIIKLLLEKNVDMNTENTLNDTPLALNLTTRVPFATKKEIAEMLIKKGADIKPILAIHEDFTDEYLDSIFGKNDDMLELLMTYAIRDKDYKPTSDAHPRVKNMYTRLIERKGTEEVAKTKGLPTEVGKGITKFLGGKRKTKKSKKPSNKTKKSKKTSNKTNKKNSKSKNTKK